MRRLLAILFVAAAAAQEPVIDRAAKALEENNFEAAAPLLKEAAEVEPDNASIFFNLGYALAELNRDDEAIGAYRRALEIEPDLPQAFPNLGILLLRNDRPADALPYLEKAAAAKPDNAELVYFWAHATAASGKPEAAIDVYRKAAELDPSNTAVWLELGQTQERLSQVDEAAASYAKAAQIDPQLRSYQLELAEHVEKQGGREKALEMYRDYLKADPSQSAVQERIGILLLELDRYQEAAEALQKAIDDHPTPAAEEALADAYDRLNDKDAARAQWAAAVAANPKDPELRLRYGASLVQVPDYESAHEQYFAAVQLDQGNATAWVGLAFTLFQLENFPGALKALDNAEKLEPLNAAGVYLRAMAQDRSQLYAEAKASYEAFLNMHSGMKNEEWKARQRLRAVEWLMENQ